VLVLRAHPADIRSVAERAPAPSRRSRPAQRRWLRVLGSAVVVAVVYLGILPLFWPGPDVRVTVPSAVSAGEDLPLRVSVRSWHGNVRVLSARLYVDPHRSTAALSSSTSVAALPRGEWSYAALDRRTYPRTDWRELRLPLVGATAGVSPGSGRVHGTIDVELEIAEPRRRGLHLLIGYPGQRETHRLPVEFVVGP
jgi:hypothetical protein